MDFGTHIPGNESCVDTVRALHQTIVTLRTALEKSRSEILELKGKKWPTDTVEGTIRNLSIENHVLRQKHVNKQSLAKETSRKEKQKKVKQKDSKEKLPVKETQEPSQQIEKHEDNNVYVSSYGSAPKIKSLENISESRQRKLKQQLSTSTTVCFSNFFEGEKQISTANSLYIKKKSREKVNTKLPSTRETEQQKLEDAHLKDEKSIATRKVEKKSLKLNKNLQFTEEPVDNVIVSRRGSNSSFIEEHNIDELKEYAECLTRSEKLIKSPQLKRRKSDKSDGVKNKSRHKSPIKKEVCKREETFIKEKSSVLEENKLENNLTAAKEEGRESSILGEQIELVLIQQYPDDRKQVTNFSSTDVKLTKQDLSILTEQLLAQESEVEEVAVYDIDRKEIIKETSNDFKLDITNDVKENGIEEVKEVCSLELNQQNKLIEDSADTQPNYNSVDQDLSKNSVLEEENKDDLQNNSLDKDDTSNSTNTLSASQKNIEISVKIYKGSKKPIEIDIQTKKQKKKKGKQLKMNDKSQNTSFDKEYVDPATVNQLTSNERQSNIDNAIADNTVSNMLQNDVDQEVDDIELIFTTDDTKETDFKEELVPIDTYTETQLLQCPLSDYEEKLSAEASDRELEDDVFNDNFENENQENCNFQSQTYDFRRENSQIYNSKSDNSINHEDKSLKSYYSYQDSSFENKSLEKDESFDRFEEKVRIIETDISKIGIQDVEYNLGRRNTCPNPIQYKPIIHRKDSGAQTDISALPGSSWRSESSLGHKVKVGDNFTTLPSKFPHPGSRLRLSEKTVEARRVLLSDIGFTSMVPELSRSADHLCPPVRGPVVSSYGQFLRTTDLYSPAYTSQKFVWATTTPSEGSHSQSRYSSQYPLSSPPAPTRRCSAPVSPSKKAAVMKSTPSKVRFANGSLPELRSDWTTTVDSGESTDSLVEEAEHFLRRSIDCLAPCRDVCYRSDGVRITGVRRASAPEPSRDNVPPQGWQPFLPRMPRDLHLDYWVKVISPEGRVRGGRVRYVGPLMNLPEPFVGVQLSTPDGHSDGTYNARRYFNCEPYHGLFVPFKKIIMGWRP